MGKGGNLLPWVIGGLSMACVAIAVVVSANKPVAGISRTPIQKSAPVVPPAQVVPPPLAAAPAIPPAANLAPAPIAPAAPVVEVPAPPAAAPASGAQIWECRTNGQRTFSDKPCGDKPMLREVSALNIMKPTPILPAARYYEPEPSYAPEYYPPETQESVDVAYPVVVGYPVLGYPYYNRRRPDHTHRPHPGHHGPTTRKIQ
jgi:hypothetical protein